MNSLRRRPDYGEGGLNLYLNSSPEKLKKMLSREEDPLRKRWIKDALIVGKIASEIIRRKVACEILRIAGLVVR